MSQNLTLKNITASLTFLKLNEENNLQYYYENDPGHRVTFQPNGDIEINGDANLALQYLVQQCWDLFFNNKPNSQKFSTITIFDYLTIDLENQEVKHLKGNNSESF